MEKHAETECFFFDILQNTHPSPPFHQNTEHRFQIDPFLDRSLMSSPQYCRSRHNPGLARKNPQDDGCQGANLIEEDKQGTPPEPLIDDTELISLDEWMAFLDAIPDEIWTSKFSNTRHINAANGISWRI